MTISVIVSNFNGARYLPKLLDSYRSQQGVELEIIVVDRNSTDASREILARYPNVRTTSEPPETGLVAGYAVGRKLASAELLFFSNEDMWFEPNCLALLKSQFTSDDRVGGVMPIQLSYDGNRVVQAGTWFTKARWYRDNPHPFRASVFRKVNEPELISGINAGACMLSSKAYDAVGGWDTSFFLDYEDMDLSLRLWQQGWLCRIEPNAVVYHDVGASNAKPIHGGRTMVGTKRYIGALANQVTIAMKTFTGLAPLAVPALLADRLMRDVLRRRWADARLDLDAIGLTLQRVPDVLEYRRRNRVWNQQRPGQNFFSDPRFDVARPGAG